MTRMYGRTFVAEPSSADSASRAAQLPVSSELGMRTALTAMLAFLCASDIFSWNVSLGPGLSSKNALVYLLTMFLIYKYAVQGTFVLQQRAIIACFAVLIGYAIVTTLVAGSIVDYPRYELLQSLISIKSRLIDQAVFFLVFFYAFHESKNALALIRALLLAVTLANVVSVLDAFGVLQITELEDRADGRLRGAIGEPNQYAAFVCLFIPMLVAATAAWRGKWRLIWFSGLLISAAAVLMTASRGALVAVVFSIALGGVLFRQYVSWQFVARAALAGVALLAVALAILSFEHRQLILDRFFGISSSSDLVTASSGRTEVWATALGRMMESPITLLSGFGWDVYWTMPFRYAPHNHYLALFFNLGMVGLISGTLLIVLTVREAVRAAAVAAPTQRTVLISFAIGAIAMAVAAFFVDLYQPWLWFWAYAGLTLRIAVNSTSANVVRSAVPDRSLSSSDSYGWRAGVPHGRS